MPTRAQASWLLSLSPSPSLCLSQLPSALLQLTINAAWPLADIPLAAEIMDLLQTATHYRQAKKGANEGACQASALPCRAPNFLRPKTRN